MDYEEMKLECLKVALSAGYTGDKLEVQAERLYNFCRGRGKYSEVHGDPFREPKLENEHVTVHGKDGDLGKFTDYVKDPNIKF